MNEQTLFAEALERTDPQDRAAFLDQACQDNPALRKRIERLLAQHEHAGDFLEAPPRGLRPTMDELTAERPGTVIGHYKLLEEIGQGGMGTVWMAQQTEPVKRLVAVKFIKPGMDSGQVVARFEQERQALALMDHPNIAKVLDGGTTPSGRPYFVMDLVKGVPITKYCDEHRLTPRQRLELFIPVCQAVQHAHQKGIIHRDLKPSNVLVALYDGKPVPKVIDFGVAKAMGQQLTEQTLHTGFGAIVGTLEYMSPEQATLNNLDIDTRSDIYALGVLLYELLTGTTPLEHKRVQESGLIEALRIIREEEMPTLSNRLSSTAELPTIAANRGTEPAKLTRLVRGELDWIVMKCLEKDRNRRYETANALALDVQRYLADEPVLACPPSMGYRLRKFARRNKQALVMAGVMALATLLAVGALGWALRDREARQLAAARQEADRLEKLEAQIRDALKEAEGAYQRDRLPDALAQVQRAECLLPTGHVSPELKQRVQQWQADIKMVALLEKMRLDREAPSYGPSKDLDDLRLRMATDDAFRQTLHEYDLDIDALLQRKTTGAAIRNMVRYALSDRAYRRAFREYGLEIETLDPAETARRISQSPIKDKLVTALDDWMLMQRTERPASIGGPKLLPLDAITNRVDPNPWREPSFNLAKMAEDERFLSRPAAVLSAVRRLYGPQFQANRELIINILKRAQLRHPDDVWLNVELGALLVHRIEGEGVADRPMEAIGYLRAALAARPGSVALHLRILDAYASAGNLVAAELECREVVARLDPGNIRAQYLLFSLLWQQRKLGDAVALAREWHRQGIGNLYPFYYPQLCGELVVQGQAHARLGEWDKALTAFDGAMYEPPPGQTAVPRLCRASDSHARNYSAILRLHAGDVAGYRRVRREMLERYAACHDGESAGRVALACLLAPVAPSDLEQVLKLAFRAVELPYGPDHPDPTRLLAYYRAGRDEDVLLRIAKAKNPPATHLAVAAMAHHRLGHAAEARAALTAAKAIMEKTPEPTNDKPLAEKWDHWLHCRILCREAEDALAKAPRKPEVILSKAILWGESEPHPYSKLKNSASLCLQQGRPAEAARLMQEALTVDCPRRSWQDLRQAALAAAQAASGQGDAARLAEPERTKWRKQALMWLRTILEIVWEELEKPIIQRSLSPSQLEALEYEPFYAGLREADALAKLPAEERQTWVQFWTEVDALLQQAGRVAGGRLNSRGLYLLFEKKYTEAEKAFRECLAVREKEAPNSWETFETMSQLGGVLLVQKKYADAEPLLLRAYEGMKRASIPNNTAAGPPGRARSAVEKSYYLTAALGRVISLLELTRESSQTRFSGTFTEASLKQTHEVKLTAGNICVIQLKSPGLMYLDVKDAKETLVFRERHRWEPEQRNSTIFKFLFTPKLDGVYRFVAGSYFEPPLRNVRPNGLGDYEIVVQEYAGMKKSSGK